jgi:undecaprenol kinase
MDTKRLKRSFLFAWRGLKENYKKEQNFRIQLTIALGVLLAGALLQIEWERMFALVFMVGMVLSFEVMNSALERYIDQISPEINDEIGVAKDVLAGAVLITSVIAIIVGVIVFYDPVVSWLGVI